MLQLLISVSKNLIVTPDGRVRRPGSAHGVSLKKARKGTAKANPIVHFFLLDAQTKARYAEIGQPGDMPAIADFLKRALNHETSGPIRMGARPENGIAISNITLEAYPEVLDILKSLGYPAYRPDTSSLKSAARTLTVWEQEISCDFIVLKGLYATWKAFVPLAALRASPFFSADNDDKHPSYRAASKILSDTLKEITSESIEELEWIYSFRTKLDITGTRFEKGRCADAYKREGFRYTYAGIDWVVSTGTGEYRMNLFSCPENPNFIHLATPVGKMPLEVWSKMENRCGFLGQAEGPVDFVEIIQTWSEVVADASAFTSLATAQTAATPIGTINFKEKSAETQEFDRWTDEKFRRRYGRYPQLLT